MPYDPHLADRIESLLPGLNLLPEEEIGKLKMFGGLCFSLNKKMLVGVTNERVVVRISNEDFAAGLENGTVDPMDLTGRPLRNFAFLNPDSVISDEFLMDRIERSATYVRDYMLSKSR